LLGKEVIELLGCEGGLAVFKLFANFQDRCGIDGAFAIVPGVADEWWIREKTYFEK
jgi:hypothetical protein